MSSYNVIVVKGNGAEDIEQYEEGIAGGTIKPGDCIKLHSDGTYIVNAEADVNVECLIATEDNLILQGLTIDDSYTTGEPVSFAKVQSGMEVQVRLAAAQAIDPASFLTPNTAGKFKEVATTEYRMFKSLDTNAASALNDLCLARKL